jgi:putative nucleotidyltransferase with HDIG domain
VTTVARAQQSLMDIHPRELKTLVKDLPTLPVVFRQLFSMMQDPDVQAPALAAFIARDQSLTIRILRLVNSALYGNDKAVASISRAVVIMGFQAVRSAALVTSVFEHFAGLDSTKDFPLDDFWRHSVASSCLARRISVSRRIANPDDAYVVGLLHDVGKLMMLLHFTDDVSALCHAAREQRFTWVACEEALFTVNHAVIARAVFRAWDFPEGVIEAVACHHRPRAASRHAELAAIAHVADYLAGIAGYPCPGARPPDLVAPEATNLLGLDETMLDDIVEQCREEIGRTQEILQLAS